MFQTKIVGVWRGGRCRRKMELSNENQRLLVWRVRKKSRMTSRFLLGADI